MGGVRNTRQKEAILRAALASREHPTADMIYAAVRHDVPGISLGTVYRNLQRLVEEGKLSLAPIASDGPSQPPAAHRPRGRSARFDPITAPHDHFVCQRCQKIHDVPRAAVGALDFRTLERRGFRVEAHTVSIHGLCAECAAEPGRAEGGRTGTGRRPGR